MLFFRRHEGGEYDDNESPRQLRGRPYPFLTGQTRHAIDNEVDKYIDDLVTSSPFPPPRAPRVSPPKYAPSREQPYKLNKGDPGQRETVLVMSAIGDLEDIKAERGHLRAEVEELKRHNAKLKVSASVNV